MSNRLTFSLASLILIFALAFAAMPVLAHDGDDNHDQDTTGHAEVESITADKTVINASGRITATVTFKMAAAASDDDPQTVHAILSPTGVDAASDFSIVDSADSTATALEIFDVLEVTAPVTPDPDNNIAGAKGVYRISIRPGSVTAGTDDGVYTISVANSIIGANAGTSDPVGGELDITLDLTAPTVASIAMQAKSGEDFQDEWTRDFEIMVIVGDVGTGATGINASTLSLEADPAILTLSASPIRRPGQNQFVFSAEIKALTASDAAETTATSVTITASLEDMAGNMSADAADTTTMHDPTAMVNIAARTHPDRAPGKPGKPTATPLTGDDDGKVMISWAAPSDTGNPALTGYYITKHYTDANDMAAKKRFPETGTTAADATSYTIPPEDAMETRVPAGMYTFTVTAVNANAETTSDMSDSITIDPPTDDPPMFAEETEAYTVVAGTTVSLILPAAVDTEDDAANKALTYSVTNNLPAGLDFTAADRTVAGTPTTAGLATVTYTVTDSAMQADSMLITFTVNPAPVTPPPPPGPTPLPDPPAFPDPTKIIVPPLTAGTAMTPVSLPTTATGNRGTLNYSLWVGQKDITASGYNGLSYDPVNVALMGKPIAADTTGTIFTWRATDSATNLSADVTFTVVVNPGTTPPDPPTPPTVITVTARSANLGSILLLPSTKPTSARVSIGPNETSFELTLVSSKAVPGGILSALRISNERVIRLYAGAAPNTWIVQLAHARLAQTGNQTVYVNARSGFKLQTMDGTTAVDISVLEVTLDREGPRVEWIGVHRVIPTEGGPFKVNIRFNEELGAAPVAGNFTITNGAISEIVTLSAADEWYRPTYLATITPDHGVGPTAAAAKQKVEVRLNGNLLDTHGNASRAVGADEAPNATFVIRKATTAPSTPPGPAPVGTIKATLSADEKTTTITEGRIAANGFCCD